MHMKTQFSISVSTLRKQLLLICAVSMCLLTRAEASAPWMVDYEGPQRVIEQTQGCPGSFPGVMYPALVYNLGCIPWDLEFNGQMSGDLTDVYFQWYRYPSGGSQANATPCTWQTDHTTYEGFKPATDEMGSRYIYFCKATKASCGDVISGTFDVQIGQNGDPCVTFSGQTFTITSGGSYTSGQTVTITANTTAYGGDHQYTWYHNGVEMDTTDHAHYEFVWGFNQPKLIIKNVTPDDGGTYSVSMQDGAECFMYTDPVRILVDNPTCGPNPTLTVAKSAICAGDKTSTSLTNNILAQGEIGKLEYMLKPDGSNPTSTAPGEWSADKPGLYQFKYVVDNPSNESCYRESKVVSVTVAGGGDASVTPSAEVLLIQNQVTFTVSAPGTDETGTITFTSDGGQSGSIYPNTYPNYGHKCYNPGLYTYTYTLTNSKAGCTRTAQCQVLWYQCDWGVAKFNTSQPADGSKVKVGKAINLSPSNPTVNGIIRVYTYSLDGGNPVEIDPAQPFTPTEPGTYVFKLEYKHSDSRVTDCRSEATRTIIVEPCGTIATLATDKETLKVGESATLTYNSPASGETIKLTYTKDGGSAQPAATTPSPYTFTPSEPGTYVFTYSIKPSDCDASTASVTIKVYDCGPDASVSSDLTAVKPGDPVTISVSNPGADETGVLTYKRDNDPAVTVNAGVFTPTQEGTYVFTYTITHAYIDCKRSATATVKVANCGDPVSVSADKKELKLGESATISLSRDPDAQAGETATLTVSKNGGSKQPLTNPIITPDAVGTYVVNYHLTNSTLQCEAEDEITIRVGECGADASISADKNAVAPGQTINLMLSAVGADEKGELTYSLNGGAAQTISGTTFMPNAAGVYVFTWSIKHDFLDCTRSESVTVTAYECGTPAAISTDKTELKSGESATLTLSAVSADETATLSVSKDGGAAQTISGTTFSPTEAGTYVITYTVSHNQIDCSTSASVTITVYDCGPAAAITLSETEIKLLRPVTITLSAPGAGETATLAVSINGGAAQAITDTQSPVTYTPQELGTYVFTYTITHPTIDCKRSATATLKVVEAELVFDDKSGSRLWSDPKNWWPSYSRIPTIADSSVIRKPCEVDIANAQTYDLTFDIVEEMVYSGAALTILPKGALVVAHHLTGVKEDMLYIKADEKNNGALVLGPENTDIPATVQFYARSAEKETLYPTWQYMGYPLQENALIASAYPEAVFYEWTNTPNTKTGGNWNRIDSLQGKIAPFTGYCMTQTKEQSYTLKGKLNNPAQKTVKVPYNDKGSYPGFAFVANSWVAPIDIAAMETADFGAADATIYIMNAGTYAQALQQQGNESTDGTGAAKGQYNTIPVHAASYLPNALSVIPPMQGFFVHATQATTLNLDYTKAVYTSALKGVNTTATRAPQRENGASEVESVLRLYVSGFGAEDEVWILTGEDFTPRFENGWDGYKARSEISPVSLSVLSPDGPLAVAAVPETEGTEIVFDGGNHKTYTLNIQMVNDQIVNDLYLFDKETETYTLLENGATYNFTCGAAARRFVITRHNKSITEEQMNNEEDKPFKFIQNGILYIRHDGKVYNAMGGETR